MGRVYTDAGLPGAKQVSDNLSQTTLAVKSPLPLSGLGDRRPGLGEALEGPAGCPVPWGRLGRGDLSPR